MESHSKNQAYYLDYLKKTDTWPRSVYHAPKHELVANFFKELPKGSRVLDAACGAGNISNKYANDYDLVGIDEQQSAIDYCRENYSGEYFQEDIYNLSLSDNSFDGIVFLDSIEHFREPVLALKQLARVLKPGGKILVCTINYSNPLWLILENTWHRLMSGNCHTFHADVHPTRYTAKLLREHCNACFHELDLSKRVMRMELFYLGEK